MGLDFPNPLGLAPGFRQECRSARCHAGAGLRLCGSRHSDATTAGRQSEAAPFPPQGRRSRDQSYGLQQRRSCGRRPPPGCPPQPRPALSASISVPTRTAEDRTADYAEGVRWFGPRASYLTINISSPNTPGLRGLQSRDELVRLLDQCQCEARLQAAAPSAGLPENRSRILPMPGIGGHRGLSPAKGEVDAVIISNTTLSRPELAFPPFRNEQGGLSGKPLFANCPPDNWQNSTSSRGGQACR